MVNCFNASSSSSQLHLKYLNPSHSNPTLDWELLPTQTTSQLLFPLLLLLVVVTQSPESQGMNQPSQPKVADSCHPPLFDSFNSRLISCMHAYEHRGGSVQPSAYSPYIGSRQSVKPVAGMYRDIRSFLAGTVESALAMEYSHSLFLYNEVGTPYSLSNA